MAEALMELYETISPEAQREPFDFALFLASRQASRTKDSAVLKSRIYPAAVALVCVSSFALTLEDVKRGRHFS